MSSIAPDKAVQPPSARLTATSINGKPFPSLTDASLEDLVSGFETGLFTSADLTEAYIARINEVNDELKAVIVINPDAGSIAAGLDAERAAGRVRGPLHGVPILLKDIIATDDKMDNTAGSYALVGARVPEDSTVAAKLRQAGAVILGKANLCEWSHGRGRPTSNGWSAVGGQTRAAYCKDQDPSGSSGGSGVAASIGLAFAALGSETHGSILMPAGVNNVVGLKPTVGLTSRYLVVPSSERQDSVGPMARTVKDAAYVLSAIAGRDPKDGYTAAIPFETVPDYARACDYFALRGKRLGVPRNVFALGESPNMDAMVPYFDAALDVLRAAGATVVDNISFRGFDAMRKGGYQTVVMRGDFVGNIRDKYLAHLVTNPNNLHKLEDILEFTQRDPREEYPRRGTSNWQGGLDLGFENDDPRFREALETMLRLAGEEGLTGAMAEHRLDAVVLPTFLAPGFPAKLGTPVISVPLGSFPAGTEVKRDGLADLVDVGPNVPFGISFLGELFSEEKLIGLAYAFEQRTKARDAIRPFVEPRTELVDVVNKRKSSEKST